MSLVDLIVNAQRAYRSMDDAVMCEAEFIADFISGSGYVLNHAHVIVDWLGDCNCSNCGEDVDCTKPFCASCGARLDEPTEKTDREEKDDTETNDGI